jgi:DHA1 family tetracycline resistance protein-like MFS transporter
MTQRVKLAVLFATLVINVLGIGIMLPVVPILVRELNGGEIGSAATIYGLLIALYSLMQFLFGPAIGALADRFGRRPILLLCMLGLSVDYLLLALAPNLWIVVVARIVGGVFGASVTTASAYIADITPPEHRAQNFGLIGVAFGVGFVIGPLFGGILGEYGARVPVDAAGAVTFVAFLFAWFLLPESLDREHRRRFRLSEANPVGAFLVVARYPAVAALMAIFVLAQFAERMLEANWVLFTAYRFEWGAAAVGVSFAWVGILFVFTQGVLVRVVVPKLGEWRTLTMGLAIAAVCMATIAFANRGWMLYVIIIPYVLGWGLSGPAIQALVTRAVPKNEQGILQGAITSAATASGVVAAPLSGALFGYFIDPTTPVHLPGIAFLVGSVLFVAGLALAWRPLPAIAPQTSGSTTAPPPAIVPPAAPREPAE